MTTVIQFTETDPTVASGLKAQTAAMLSAMCQFDVWAATHPGYVTQPIQATDWKAHQTTAGLYWVDWGTLYTSALTDAGRLMANTLIGTVAAPGPLIGHLLPPGNVLQLDLVDVADLVASGYLPAPTVP